jgi:hypothetical protein
VTGSSTTNELDCRSFTRPPTVDILRSRTGCRAIEGSPQAGLKIDGLRSKWRPRVTGLTPVRPITLADEDLDPGIRGLLEDYRARLGPHGWKVHVEKVGDYLSFQFDNPLSAISKGMQFERRRSLAQIKHQLDEGIHEDPEFARTQLAVAPRRQRRLIGALRYAATLYGWPNKVFEEVIEVLFHFRSISKAEWEWMKAVGPQAWPERIELDVRKHQRAERRRKKSKPD